MSKLICHFPLFSFRKASFYLYFIFTLFPLLSFSQSFSFEDLLNLQKSNLEKAKGFFSYKGFTWQTTEKEYVGAFVSNGYRLTYDKIIWQKNSETVHYLSKTGSENAVIYYTNQNHFSKLENVVKSQFKVSETNTSETKFWTTYKNQNLSITFNTRKIKRDYEVQMEYEICVINFPDVDKQVSLLCEKCKGRGQIIENKKCSNCNASGFESCYNCNSKGNIICRNCNEGKSKCNFCSGRGSLQCNTCRGQGKSRCDKCNGYGTISTCPKCNGAGKITANLGFLTSSVTCSTCKGTGRGNFTCPICSGAKTTTCTNCSSTGILQCTYCSASGQQECQSCKGNYSQICEKCNGKGITINPCRYCNGKGRTSEEIKVTCPVCNGSKLNVK